jgi:hypothetical protein
MVHHENHNYVKCHEYYIMILVILQCLNELKKNLVNKLFFFFFGGIFSK